MKSTYQVGRHFAAQGGQAEATKHLASTRIRATYSVYGEHTAYLRVYNAYSSSNRHPGRFEGLNSRRGRRTRPEHSGEDGRLRGEQEVRGAGKARQRQRWTGVGRPQTRRRSTCRAQTRRARATGRQTAAVPSRTLFASANAGQRGNASSGISDIFRGYG